MKDTKEIEEALKDVKGKYQEYECSQCHCIFEGRDECVEHSKEKKHHAFKLKGTNIILSIG